jgi:hypothetical protein
LLKQFTVVWTACPGVPVTIVDQLVGGSGPILPKIVTVGEIGLWALYSGLKQYKHSQVSYAFYLQFFKDEKLLLNHLDNQPILILLPYL